MSVTLYKRYIPPSTAATARDSSAPADNQSQFVGKLRKRKREAAENDAKEKPEQTKSSKKKRKSESRVAEDPLGEGSSKADRKAKTATTNTDKSDPSEGAQEKHREATPRNSKKDRKKDKILDEPMKETESRKRDKKKKKKGALKDDETGDETVPVEIRPDTDTQSRADVEEPPLIHPAGETKQKKKKSKSKLNSAEIQPSITGKATGEDPQPGTGHSLILQKLRKSLARAVAAKPAHSETTFAEDIPAEEPIVPTGLESLPQPEPVQQSRKPVSAFSTLPPWLQTPITVSPTTEIPFKEIPNISPRTLQRLESLSLKDAFAVQSVVVPMLLDHKNITRGDICISAATGSGKTLAYLLPVLETLISRVVTRLRVIVVVPTRELVQQVNSVAISLVSGTGLKIGTAIGSRPLESEQNLLVGKVDGEYESKIDILITTPGRLVEHVRTTQGFDLTHVRWLIIDEADRLLAQSFQEWVDIVIGGLEKARYELSRKRETVGNVKLRDLGLRPAVHRVRKIVLSATMTRDVGKLAELRLRRPSLVVVEDPPLPVDADTTMDIDAAHDELGEQFSVPGGLKEHVLPVDNIEFKPLYMMYLLRANSIKSGVLIFVKSNEGAARLAKMLEAVSTKEVRGRPLSVGLVTGEMEKKRREKVLKRFTRGEVDLLICSDLISRGLDLPNVRHIINYDIPASTRAYIHRVGRTARAGKEGDAWTLLVNREARWFWEAIGKGIRRSIALEKVSVDMELEGYGLRGVYEEVLYGKEVEGGE